MKTIIIFMISGFVLSLSACGKSDLEKSNEESVAMSRKTAGSVANMPRINLTLDNKKEAGK